MKKENLSGRIHLKGGQESLKKLADLLRIEHSASNKGNYQLKSVEWVNGRIKLGIREKNKEIINVILKSSPEDGYFAKTENLYICLEGKVNLTESIIDTLNRISYSLGNITSQCLLEIFLRDSKSELIAPSDVNLSKCTWGSPEQWHQFFCSSCEVDNYIVEVLDIKGPYSAINYGDTECDFVKPHMAASPIRFYNFFWTYKMDFKRVPLYYVKIDDSDVIMGSIEKIDRLISWLKKEKKNELIILNATCVPVITGEDLKSVVKKHQTKSNEIILEIEKMTEPFSPQIKLLTAIKEKYWRSRNLKKEKSINLVGFIKDKALKEIICMLKEMGIKVNSCLFPQIDLIESKSYMASDLQVFFPFSSYEKLYQNVFYDIDMRSISPTAPYGIKNTRNWINSIISLVDKKEKARRVLEKYYNRVAERWDFLSKEARKYRVGFIIDVLQITKLKEDRFMSGIPILSVLDEMGFGIDVLLYINEGVDLQLSDPLGIFLRRWLSLSEKHTIKIFQTRDELEQLLRKRDFQIVYSEFFFDERLNKSGKAQFSLKYFEVGFEGAVRSLERLLCACKMSFYRDYYRYL